MQYLGGSCPRRVSNMKHIVNTVCYCHLLQILYSIAKFKVKSWREAGISQLWIRMIHLRLVCSLIFFNIPNGIKSMKGIINVLDFFWHDCTHLKIRFGTFKPVTRSFHINEIYRIQYIIALNISTYSKNKSKVRCIVSFILLWCKDCTYRRTVHKLFTYEWGLTIVTVPQLWQRALPEPATNDKRGNFYRQPGICFSFEFYLKKYSYWKWVPLAHSFMRSMLKNYFWGKI